MTETDANSKIVRFLEDQIERADFRTQAYVFNDKRVKNPSRSAFLRLRKHINDFLLGKQEPRWVIMSGLRGAGKTTLLAQLYAQTALDKKRKLFLSVDQIKQTLGVSLGEILQAYEGYLGESFEALTAPVVIFLDEVQYDKSWAALVKTIYDRSKKVFILTTGSSALSLQTNPDVNRRAIYEKLFPMSFTEFIKIKQGKYEIKGLCQSLRSILFESQNAKEVYDGLQLQAENVRKYWSEIDPKEVQSYISFGTLPFMLALSNVALVYDQIKKTLDRVITNDIAQIEQFEGEIISKIPMVLYAMADSNQLSLVNLSKDLGISRPTLEKILSTLEKTETILRIYPYGSHTSQARKPSKYLFVSPAFRAMYYYFIGNTKSEADYKGQLLEDTIGLYLYKAFSSKPGASITYDNAEGGADFIFGLRDRKIILEVGYKKGNSKQVKKTMGKVKAKYGLVVTDQPTLGLDIESGIVTLPLSYFLLV